MLLGEKLITWVTGGSSPRELQTTEYLEDLNQGWQQGTLHLIFLISYLKLVL